MHEQAIKRLVDRLARDTQPVRIELSKVDAMMLMESVLLACRHPEHAKLKTHARIRDLATKILLDVGGGEPDARALLDACLEHVP